MYRWFNDVGYRANIPMARTEYPPLKTLSKFLNDESWVRAEMVAQATAT